jgi:hypothetical protein
MLSDAERRLLYILARDYVTDGSAIVDGRCFLGGSTAALLAGLRDRPGALVLTTAFEFRQVPD